MSTRWLLLLLGTALLLAPLPAFYSRKRRFRTLHTLDIERRNGSWLGVWKQILRFSGHWIDLARAILGSVCFLFSADELRGVSKFYDSHAGWAQSVVPLTLASVGVIMIGILFRYPGRAVAPVPFVAGTIAVLVPLPVAASALVLAAFCAVTLRSLTLFFLSGAIAMAALGFFLDRHLLPSMAGAVLTFLPLAMAFFRNQELVIPVRRPGNESGNKTKGD